MIYWLNQKLFTDKKLLIIFLHTFELEDNLLTQQVYNLFSSFGII